MLRFVSSIAGTTKMTSSSTTNLHSLFRIGLFYKNIVKRGYLVYDSDILLDIHSSIARTLYMLLEKIRFDQLYIRESIFALIKKIPLKYEKKSLPVTIKTLDKAFT